MPTLAFADILPDFSASAAPAVNRVRDSQDEKPPHLFPGSNEGESEDVAVLIARAEAAVLERVQREHEKALAAERRRHEKEMEALRESLSREAGERIAARIDEMEREITSVTTMQAARILGMALRKELQHKSIKRLAEIITGAITDQHAVHIEVQGPADLWEHLQGALGERSARVAFVEAAQVDISVEIDDRLFETRLAEWSETLAEVLV